MHRPSLQTFSGFQMDSITYLIIFVPPRSPPLVLMQLRVGFLVMRKTEEDEFLGPDPATTHRYASV